MPTLLLTYFGPFQGTPYNPTEAVARRVAAALATSAPHLRVHTRELPVEFAASSTDLTQALAETKPDLAISLGVAAGRAKLSLERVAINLDAARIPDNAGTQLMDTPIRDGGPAAYFSTLPTRAIFEELSAESLPVELSYTAGTFVCNHILYELMHATGGQIPAGFIHIPMSSPGSAVPGQKETPPPLQAYAETGGVESGDVPTLPQALLAQMVERAALITLSTLG